MIRGWIKKEEDGGGRGMRMEEEKERRRNNKNLSYIYLLILYRKCIYVSIASETKRLSTKKPKTLPLKFLKKSNTLLPLISHSVYKEATSSPEIW